MGKKSREIALTFTWQEAADKYFKVYKDLIQQLVKCFKENVWDFWV